MINLLNKKEDLSPVVRGDKETIESFKKRRAERNQLITKKLKPRLVWDSSKLGTLIRPKTNATSK